eukprot:4449130-Amphidinium_carterae.1
MDSDDDREEGWRQLQAAAGYQAASKPQMHFTSTIKEAQGWTTSATCKVGLQYCLELCLRIEEDGSMRTHYKTNSERVRSGKTSRCAKTCFDKK